MTFKEVKQDVIDKKPSLKKDVIEFKKCPFCEETEKSVPGNYNKGFDKTFVLKRKNINGIMYHARQYDCNTCKSRWLGNWHLE